MALLALIFPTEIISVYTSDPELASLTAPVLQVITGALVLFSVSMVIFQSVSGTGNTDMALFIEVLTIIIYVVYTWLVSIVYPSSPEIIWCAEYVIFHSGWPFLSLSQIGPLEKEKLLNLD